MGGHIVEESAAFKSAVRAKTEATVAKTGEVIGDVVTGAAALKSAARAKTDDVVDATVSALEAAAGVAADKSAAFKSAARAAVEDAAEKSAAFKSAARATAIEGMEKSAAFKSALRANTDAFKSSLRAKTDQVAGALMGFDKPVPLAPTVPAGCMSAYDVAASAGLSTLTAAIDASNLGDILKSPGLIATVFAPTNEAFADLLEEAGVDAATLLADTELVNRVLRYHVIPGKSLTTAKLLDGNYYETLLFPEQGKIKGAYQVVVDYEKIVDMTKTNGLKAVLGQIPAEAVTENWYVNEAFIAAPDAQAACPTVIHVIDTVLSPPEPVEIASIWEGHSDLYNQALELVNP
jgi:uncharacterized surface protein with fasciclin (FAS1) repeats